MTMSSGFRCGPGENGRTDEWNRRWRWRKGSSEADRQADRPGYSDTRLVYVFKELVMIMVEDEEE